MKPIAELQHALAASSRSTTDMTAPFARTVIEVPSDVVPFISAAGLQASGLCAGGRA